MIAKCYCQNCGDRLEFESDALTEENSVIACPHCGLETELYIPMGGDEISAPAIPTELEAELLSQRLPTFTEESLRAIPIRGTTTGNTYTVNLLDYTCTNPLCNALRPKIPPRDVGRICKHIVSALRMRRLVSTLPPIAKAIVESGSPDEAWGIYPGQFATDMNGSLVYIGGKSPSGWRTVVACKQRGSQTYTRFEYNAGVWNYGRGTPIYDGMSSLKVLPKIDAQLLA